VSLGVAVEMTGLDKQEILDYAGGTMMFDRLKDEKGIEERMKAARKFLAG
jgi:trehalose-6-phosphate synthase